MSSFRPGKPDPRKAAPAEKQKQTGQLIAQPCQDCGKPRSAWGFRRAGEPQRWYCSDHQESGAAWLRKI